jgi:hypothetical protein
MFAPSVLEDWVPPVATLGAIAVAAVVADAAVAGAVSETPIACSSDCNKLLNRSPFVAGAEAELAALELVLEPTCPPFLWP